MAPWVPFTDGYEAQLISTYGGEIVENTLWFWDEDGPASYTTQQEAADGVAQWYIDWVLPYLSDQLTFSVVELRDWSTSARPIVAVSNPNLPGGTSGYAHSANVSIRVPFRWPSNRRGRQNSNFLPGIPGDAIDVNDLQPYFADAMFDAYVALIDEPPGWSPGNNWNWVVTSRRLANAPRSSMYFGACIGPAARTKYTVTTRRKRLPGQ